MFKTGRQHDKTRSCVCPCTCVGPDTDCTRLEESIRLRKSLTSSLIRRQTWILKSQTIRSQLYWGSQEIREVTDKVFVIFRLVHHSAHYKVRSIQLKHIEFKAGIEVRQQLPTVQMFWGSEQRWNCITQGCITICGLYSKKLYATFEQFISHHWNILVIKLFPITPFYSSFSHTSSGLTWPAHL